MTRWIAALGAVAIMAVACGSEPATPTAVSDDATPDQTTADIDVPSTMLPTTTVRSATTIEATTVATQPTTVTTSATTAPTTTGPATTPTTSPGLTSPAILRPDGLGPFAFGTPADQVQAWLARELGEADATAVEGSGGWPLESCNERRFSYWASAGFVVGFTDLLGYDSDSGVANCGDVPRLEAWYVTEYAQPWFLPDHDEGLPTEIELRLVTEDGIGLRSTAGELRAAELGVEFGVWDIDTYVAEAFLTPSGFGGRVNWDSIADLQRGAE